MREEDENLKRFIKNGVKGLTDELSETERLLQKLLDSTQSHMYAVKDIAEIKKSCYPLRNTQRAHIQMY